VHKIAIGLTTMNCMVHWVGLISCFNAMSGRDWRDYEFKVLPHTGIYIDSIRNNIVREFLASDSEYLLFLDYDNGFEPDWMDLFMEDFGDPNVDIVSGIYHFKDNRGLLVAGMTPEQAQDGWWEFIPECAFTENLVNLTKAGAGRSALVGAGMLMVRRVVFESIDEPWFFTHYQVDHNDGSLHHVGEDSNFCSLVQSFGFDIYIDQRIRSAHMAGNNCYPPHWRPY